MLYQQPMNTGIYYLFLQHNFEDLIRPYFMDKCNNSALEYFLQSIIFSSPSPFFPPFYNLWRPFTKGCTMVNQINSSKCELLRFNGPITVWEIMKPAYY